MSRSGGLEFDNIDKWLVWLKWADKDGVKKCKSRILRSAALRGLEYAQDLTPRRSARLAQSLAMGRRDNYFTLKVGPVSTVVFGTNVEYAAAIEDGFDQSDRKGDFIPGVWSNDVFHYDPNADGGMVLTGAVIPGAHMFQKAMDNLEAGDMDAITLFEFRRLYAELQG